MIQNQNIEIYIVKPTDFNSRGQTTGCFVEHDGKLLLLQRGTNGRHAGAWGSPGGKIELNESAEDAARRELFEETGIIAPALSLEFYGTYFVRVAQADFTYHLFKVSMAAPPEVRLSNEHCNYIWVTPKESETLPLMLGQSEAIRIIQTSLPF